VTKSKRGRDQFRKPKGNKNMTYQVVRLSDLLKETDADGSGIPDRILKLRPFTILVDVHVVLESSVQQASEERLEMVGLVGMDVVPVVTAMKEVTSMALGRGDGVGKEEVLKPFGPQRESTRPDEHILRLRVRTASATASPTELRPIEGPLELDEVLVDLSPTESVVGDGVRVLANPARRSDGGGDGLTGGRHSDDWSEEWWWY
jgi:hypothetical protein